MKVRLQTMSIVVIALTVIALGAWGFLKLREGSVEKRIAVVGVGNSLIFDRVYNRLRKELSRSRYRNHMDAHFYLFNPTDKVQITAMCDFVLSSNPDVIVAAGATAAQTLHGIMRNKKIVKPVVCMGANTAVELGLMDSFERPGGCMTGVVNGGQGPNMRLAPVIQAAKPTVKNILVPYNALGVTVESVIQMIQEMQRYFAPYGVTVHELPLSDCAEVLQKVKSFLPGHDMLVAIEYDAFAHQFLAGYIKLCEQAGITCFSATLSGVGDGAAITYATDTAPMGTVAARMIEQILFKGALPAVMSVVSLESFSTLFINPATSAWQGYVPDIEHIKVNLAKNTATAGVQERVRVVPIKGQE